MVRIIVVGASQGGVQALQALVSGLPKNFSVPILIVQHIGSSQSILPGILNDVDGTRAAFGKDREALRDGRIYVAPPDHHMQLQDGRVELTRGPRENYARPAIDPLFRSAALYYGPDAIGVVLSGRLNDGTAGLYEIKRHGGVTVVQAPDEAEVSEMPQSALDNVAVDYCIPVAEMPRLFARLTEDSKQRSQITSGDVSMSHDKLDHPAAQTCPECGGAMREESVANLMRFRCHIGHLMTAEVLASNQLEKLDYHISAMLRTLNERVALCRDIAAKHSTNGNSRVAETWKAAAMEAEQRELVARQLVDAGWTHPEASAETEE